MYKIGWEKRRRNKYKYVKKSLLEQELKIFLKTTVRQPLETI